MSDRLPFIRSWPTRGGESMWEDISSDRNQYGWIRMSCDGPDCDESVEGRPLPGQPWPYGWEHDETTGIPRDYCPWHARLAAA